VLTGMNENLLVLFAQFTADGGRLHELRTRSYDRYKLHRVLT
jgi:hypothetical protein